MISPRDNIVVGVSGGADSVCLLFLLLAYAEEVPLTLAVVHVNHGIRKDAGEDAAYVEDLCKQHSIPFYLTEADIPRMVAEEKCSEEDAGRRVRYEAFRRVAESLGGAKIAVAHNSDDNAETMLFHLFRGSGLKGLCGIVPMRDDLIRPILCLRRGEIEEYLTQKGIRWCTDSTNAGDDYTRNRIRHHILPYAEAEIVSGAVRHMNQTAEMLRESEAYLEQQTALSLKQCLCSPAKEGEKRFEIDINRFLEIAPILQKRMLFGLAKHLSDTGKDISRVHVQDMLTLFTETGNRSLNLPFGIVAVRQYDRVILEKPDAGQSPGEQPEIIVPMEKLQEKPLVYELKSGEKVEFSLIFGEKDEEVPQNQYTKWFDYDKIDESVIIRTRRRGDYFTISDGAGNSRHKTLKDYMITEKIHKDKRDEIPLVACGNHILWLVGYRISEHFKINKNTKHILQVKLLIRDCNE